MPSSTSSQSSFTSLMKVTAPIVVTLLSTSPSLVVNGLAFPTPRSHTNIPNVQKSPALNAIAIPAPTLDDTNTSPQEEIKKDQVSWARELDYDAFAKEVTALGKKLQNGEGPADVAHMNKILRWRDTAAIVGLLTLAFPVNPITIAALSTWTYASWTMIAHHTCHGGYNRVNAGKYKSKSFAIGTLRRFLDWCDWMLPEAWNVEHNKLHHYHLSEDKDPDLVQRNLNFLREMNVPLPLKYAVVGAVIPVWKWYYYAPNTFKELQLSKMKKEDIPVDLDTTQAYTVKDMLFPKDDADKKMMKIAPPSQFVSRVIAPFLLTRFILLPLPFLLLPSLLPSLGLDGPSLVAHAVINLLLAELLTNIHAFITIVTNHAGVDLYEFSDSVRPRSGSFYVRQIISSANYEAGTDAVDFAHGWLNYQIEHHVWPDLSMLAYQKGAPELKSICDRYGVPYVQESVWERVRKTVDIMVGKESMIKFPRGIEPEGDRLKC